MGWRVLFVKARSSRIAACEMRSIVCSIEAGFANGGPRPPRGGVRFAGKDDVVKMSPDRPLPRLLAVCVVAASCIALRTTGADAAPTGAQVRAKIFAAYRDVTSYRVTVLGSVRSLGVWVAPDKYQMTTDFDGKSVRTLIIGHDYWTFSGGKWQKSGTASNSLDVDIAGLIRTAKASPSVPFVALPDQTQDGKRVGTFGFTFKNGTEEVCNFDPATYLATRCKADELTLLYSAYNAKTNVVAKP